jgi:hypothetical protein
LSSTKWLGFLGWLRSLSVYIQTVISRAASQSFLQSHGGPNKTLNHLLSFGTPHLLSLRDQVLIKPDPFPEPQLENLRDVTAAKQDFLPTGFLEMRSNYLLPLHKMAFIVLGMKREVIFSVIEPSEQSERNKITPKRLCVCLKPGG